MATYRAIYGSRDDVTIVLTISDNVSEEDVVSMLKEKRPWEFFINAICDMKTQINLLK